MIYFDSTATTKPRQEVIDAYLKMVNTYWQNPSSIYIDGVKADVIYTKCIEKAQELMNLNDHDVIFTSNATEANNLAIKGICNNYLFKNMRVITTKIEHPSVYNVFKSLETLGFDVCYLDVNEKGIIDLEQLKSLMNKETILVSIMYVNNIIGTVEPIEEVVNLVKQYPRCHLHVDMVQAIGKIDLLKEINNIDLITISSHKIEGLKGTAILFKKKNLNLLPLINGADQQLGIKPGTKDLSGAYAAVTALNYALKEQKESNIYVKELHDYLISELKKLEDVIINSNDCCSNYIVSICYFKYKAETILHFLEAKGIFISVGSACSAHKETPERTILECFKDQKRALSSIRISLSRHNTKEDIDALIEALIEFKKVRQNVR